MKQLFTILSVVILLDFTLTQCANPQSPQGGPKDTIPPTLLEANPQTGSINFKEGTITLTFSEYVNADKLNQNLIITPKTDIRFKHIVKREELVIKFEEPFNDSTTYSLNFFDGVTDITERNPAVNLVLAFSTGSFIDSAKISGQVEDLFTQEASAGFTIGLFPLSDSLNFFSQNPVYFTTTNDSGNFNISYIKAGLYRVLAFEDANRNLILDPEEEQHGFLKDTLNLIDSLTDLFIPTILQNVKPLELINHRSIGKYHEIRFNKKVDQFSIQPDTIYRNIVGENKNIIRLYNREQFAYNDSLSIFIQASDSLENTVVDTLKIVFQDSERRLPTFDYSVNYKNKVLTTDPVYNFSFNKPVIRTDETKFSFIADSTFTRTPDSIALSWNESLTSLELKAFINKDSIYNAYESLLPKDSILIDSVMVPPPTPSPIKFLISKGAFISIENDSTQVAEIQHRKDFVESFGTLKLTLETNYESFIIQLLERGNVAYEIRNERSPVFQVSPSTYDVRVLIDTNNDGKWSVGNLIKGEEPEKVYLFDESIAVRENWVIEDINISF